MEARQETVDVARAASFWRRLGGLIIDGLVIGVVQGILRLFLGQDTAGGLGLIISAAYFTYFHGSSGQTPGNAVVGIRVVDFRDGTGRSIGYGRAFLRWLVSIVSALVIFLGYLWMLWDGNRQTWHDKAAGSLPLYTRG